MGALRGWDHFYITGLLDIEKRHWINTSDHPLQRVVRFSYENLIVPIYALVRSGSELEKHDINSFFNYLVKTILTKAV